MFATFRRTKGKQTGFLGVALLDASKLGFVKLNGEDEVGVGVWKTEVSTESIIELFDMIFILH